MRSLPAVAVALLMLALAMWTVVPAPTVITLAIALGVSEFSLYVLAVFALVTVAIGIVARGRARTAAVVISIGALAALAWPPLAALATWPLVDAMVSADGIPPLRPRTLLDVNEVPNVPVPLRDGTQLALDLYLPHAGGLLPLLVTIYGGAWMFGSRRDDAEQARWYAARGYAVAVIDYRHAPVYRFPVQIDDVDDALATIARRARGWNVDPNRVALLGRSAGAQLALLAGERAQALRVRAIVGYYAPTDLVRGWEEPPVPDPARVRLILENYLGGPPDAVHAAAYRTASPLANAHAGMPAVLAIIGDRDELVRPQFQRDFAAHLTRLNVRNIALELPWASHSFDAVYGLGAPIARNATLRFLDALL